MKIIQMTTQKSGGADKSLDERAKYFSKKRINHAISEFSDMLLKG